MSPRPARTAILAAVACLVMACAAPLPPEADRLGLEIDPVIPHASVSEEEAIAIAEADLGLDDDAQKVEAFLRRVTDPGDLRRLRERAVWIVHYAGLSIDAPIPSSAPGAGRAPGITLTHAWVFIDADTGALIMNTYTP